MTHSDAISIKNNTKSELNVQNHVDIGSFHNGDICFALMRLNEVRQGQKYMRPYASTPNT